MIDLTSPAKRLVGTDLYLDIVVLLAFPFALLLVNNSWLILVPTDWIDAYVYTGYMLHLRQHIQDFGPTYYGSRLPWILLGYVAHAIFSFQFANLLLRLALFYGGTFSLYIIIRCVWRHRLPATIGAILLGSNSYFLWAISWDYVDGAGVVVVLGTLACLTLSKHGRHGQFFLFGAGFLAATAVSVQVFLIAMMPAVAAWYIVVDRSRKAKELIEDGLSVALGVLSALALYGFASLQMGGQFNYLKPQIDAARTLPENPYKASDYGWLDHAGYLTFHVIAIVVSVALLAIVVVRWRRLGSFARITVAHTAAGSTAVPLAIAVASVVYFHFRGGAELQYPFYTSYLLPFTFLVLGAALSVTLTQARRNWRLFIGGVLIVLVIGALRSDDVVLFQRFPNGRMSDGYGWLALLAAGSLVFAVVLQRTVPVVVAVIVLSLLNVGTSDERVLHFSNGNVFQQRAYLIPQADDFLRRFNSDGLIRYWYNVEEPLGGVFRGVASLQLWLYRLVSEDFPGRTIPGTLEQSPLRPGQIIAILTGRSDGLVEGQQAAAQSGVALELVDQAVINRGSERFHALVVRVLPTGLEPTLNVPLSGFQAGGELSSLTLTDSSVSIETPRKPWYYAAVLPIPTPAPAAAKNPGYIRVRGEVKGGAAGFGLIRRGKDDLLDRVSVPETTSADVFLKVEHLEDAGTLLIQTWDTKGGRVKITEVTVYVARDPGRIE